MTVVCPSTTRPVLNDFDWVENVGILSSFIPVEKCPSVMTHSRLCPEACVGVKERFFCLPHPSARGEQGFDPLLWHLGYSRLIFS
jgi:hypothetical protein